LETKSGEVDQQSETVKDIDASDQKMDEEKKLKQMNKEKSKLAEEITSLKKNIDKNNMQIDDLQKKLELNTSINIPAKKLEIEGQKEVVSNLSKTLNSIR
jgi:peptidoglycan hydrolase CwlO-like protein